MYNVGDSDVTTEYAAIRYRNFQARAGYVFVLPALEPAGFMALGA